MFFEKNRAALRQNPHNQTLLKQLEDTAPAVDAALVETPEGSYSLVYRSIPLHDPQGAQQEAKRLAQGQCQKSPHAVHLLIGLGLGYLLAEVFPETSGNLLIFEPDVALLRFVLENVDLSPYLGPRVMIAATPKALIDQLKSFYISGDPLETLVLPGCGQLYAEELLQLQPALEKYLLYAHRELEVLKASHYHWIHAFFQNIPYLPATQPLDGLLQCFKGKPALIISPGPSLDKAMADVLAVKDSMVTIAVGRAIRPLMEAGMVPDFAVFMDYVGMQEQIHQLPLSLETCAFLLAPMTQPCCFQAPAKAKFLIQTTCDDHFSHWIDQTLGTSYSRMEDVTNASIFAFNVARLMGCDPIVLIGQDLAFHGEQLYAGNVKAEVDAEQGIAVVKGHETLAAVDYVLSEIRGQDGTMLRTSTQYYVFAKELEALAQELAESSEPPRLINTSVGGAYLHGFHHQSLAAFRESTPLVPFEKEVGDRFWQDPLSPAEKATKFHQGLSTLVTGIAQTLERAKLLRQTLHTMVKSPPDQWPKYRNTYETTKRAFEEGLQEQPFLYACLFSKTITLRHSAPHPSMVESLKAAEQYYSMCIEALQESLLPWADAAQQQYKALKEAETMSLPR